MPGDVLCAISLFCLWLHTYGTELFCVYVSLIKPRTTIFNLKSEHFHSMKRISQCRLQNSGHLSYPHYVKWLVEVSSNIDNGVRWNCLWTKAKFLPPVTLRYWPSLFTGKSIVVSGRPFVVYLCEWISLKRNSSWLTHWYKMAVISQTFSNAFSSMKICEFLLVFH